MTWASSTATTTARELAPLREQGGEALWFLRVNPLPRHRLADGALACAVADLAAAEREVLLETQRCSDELYAAVAATRQEGARAARAALVALRRAVHHDRALPASPPEEVPPAARAALAALASARDDRQDRREAVRVAVAPGLQGERATLAMLLGHDDLRASLALVAPEVADAVERYRAAVTAGTEVPARLLKSERGLLQYASRALLRTSPLARFTATGLAVARDWGADLGEVGPEGAVSFPSLDRAMVHYVLGGLQRSDGGDGDAWVQLPPTAAVDPAGGRVHFLQPQGADAAVRRLAAPLTGVVRLLVDATAMGPRRRAAVVEELVARSGMPAEEARLAVDRALAVGMLCSSYGPEDAALDVTTTLADPDLAAPDLREDVLRRLPALATAAPQTRRAELAALRTALDDLSLAAGRPAAVLVEEDYVLPPLAVSTARWREQLDDLAAAVEFLSAFDRLHDVRALLSAIFVERFGQGAGVSLPEHAAALVDELLRRTVPGASDVPPAGPADGSLERLQELRRRVWEVAHADLGPAAVRGEDCAWSAPDVRALVAEVPDRFRREPLTYGVLVQPWRDRLVFNDAYAGHGMLFGRFLAADRALGGRALPLLAERLRATYGTDGARVVEDPGFHGLNVNAHPPVLDDVLTPDDWPRLRLAHDPDTDALVVRDGDGRPLRVLNLGAGHPDLFPAPLRLAVWLVTGGRLMEDLVGGWHDTTGWDGRRTRRCPRLSIGSVVLQRRRWYGGEELAGAVAAGPGPEERLVALTSWRARHGVPEEVVLTDRQEYAYRYPPDDGQTGGQPDGEEQGQRSRRRKPQYLDLASALTARVLPRLVERRGAGHVEEALPAVTDSRYAREWVVEVGRRGGGPFTWGGEAR